MLAPALGSSSTVAKLLPATGTHIILGVPELMCSVCKALWCKDTRASQPSSSWPRPATHACRPLAGPGEMLQQRALACGSLPPCRTVGRCPLPVVAPSHAACGLGGAAAACSTSTSTALAAAQPPGSTCRPGWRTTGSRHRGPAAAASTSPTASIAEQHSPCVASAHQFYHLAETNDFTSFSKLLTPDVKWRYAGVHATGPVD